MKREMVVGEGKERMSVLMPAGHGTFFGHAFSAWNRLALMLSID